MPLSYRAAQTLIKRGDEPALRAALDAGLAPHLANKNGWSLLMLTALEGAVPLGELLIARGADIEGRNRHGETALSLTAGRGHVPFLRMLLTHGASRDCTPHGTTLSTWLTSTAALSEPGRTEVFQVLGI